MDVTTLPSPLAASWKEMAPPAHCHCGVDAPSCLALPPQASSSVNLWESACWRVATPAAAIPSMSLCRCHQGRGPREVVALAGSQVERALLRSETASLSLAPPHWIAPTPPLWCSPAAVSPLLCAKEKGAVNHRRPTRHGTIGWVIEGSSVQKLPVVHVRASVRTCCTEKARVFLLKMSTSTGGMGAHPQWRKREQIVDAAHHLLPVGYCEWRTRPVRVDLRVHGSS